ncbi:MHJ_0274 family protein [Mycoplasma miroungirhinis]|uniref:Uncharacterized protein n=1 Tax=Mycoplasma miroungirhinis TaxID=754516 RepID=A0A6M4JB04_9MOLU|nr:hypothetical protein [Mycoplasma miroungirhinis]QJR44090.1 hypothetical protein HLA92_01405 [Mycoplasma miroungirhinis]
MTNLNVSYDESTPPQTQDNGGILSPNSWLMYLILGLILALIVSYILYKIIKQMVTKRKEIKKLKAKSSVNKEIYREYVISITEIIKYTNEQVKNFVPSIGKYKMQEIKDGAKNLLNILYNREDFQDFRESEKYQDFVKNIKILIDTNASTWSKTCKNEIEYFNNLYSHLQKDDSFLNYEKNVKESIERKFYEK